MDNQSPNDILRVANIDVSCESNDPEVHPEDQDHFTVYYSKNPYTIEAGKTRLFPRFIAEHFAKHLADHLLMIQDKPISDTKERPILLKQILLGTEESYAAAPEQTEGEKIAAEVEKLASRETPVAETKPTVATEDPVVPVAKEPQELEPKTTQKTETPQKPTLKELKAEADELGITYKSNVTVDQLLNLIKSF